MNKADEASFVHSKSHNTTVDTFHPEITINNPKVHSPNRDIDNQPFVDEDVEDESDTRIGQLASVLSPLVEHVIAMADKVACFDLVMVLGLTGAGKSTFINWLNDFSQEAYMADGNERIRLTEQADGAAEIGDGRVSQTKFFNVRTRAVQEADQTHQKSDIKEPLHIADTQGSCCSN